MNKKPNNNEPKMNMPKFNMNWIYILAIIALAVLYFTNGNENSSVQTTTPYSNFKTWVMKGYAQKIVVNKNSNTLVMYVKPEHIRDVFHQGVKNTGKEPSVAVEFGSVDQVEQFINQAREQKKFSGELAYDNRRESVAWVAAAWAAVEVSSALVSRRHRCMRREPLWVSPSRMWLVRLVPNKRCKRLWTS